MWSLLLALSLLVAPSLLAPAGLHAQDSDQARALLEQGRAHYADLDYSEAATVLTRALALAEGDDALRAEVLEALALDYFVMDRERASREALLELFLLDPYYVVREPSGSPRVARFIESVRRTRVRDAAIDPSVRLSVELPSAARRDVGVELAIGAAAPIERVTVVLRTDVSASWERIEATRAAGTRWVASLPSMRDASEVLLYIEGYDASSRLVMRDGGPLAPRVLPVSGADRGGDPDADVVREPWLWILVGAVAIGAAVGIGVGVAASSAEVPSGTLSPGVIRLP